VAAHKFRISEVPSVEAARLHGVSNLNAFSDGIRVLRTILTEYRRLRGGRGRVVVPPQPVHRLDARSPASSARPPAALNTHRHPVNQTHHANSLTNGGQAAHAGHVAGAGQAPNAGHPVPPARAAEPAAMAHEER
jgi:hypothetical protein